MAYIGQNGIALDKKEGDKKTPEGIFDLGIAFGMNATINNNKIKYKNIDEYLYWVDDVNSKYYNQLVDSRNINKDWKSAEHLIEYPKEYEYAIEIKSNPENEKGKGSAVFLHCSNSKATSGCVAIDKKTMQELMNIIEGNAIIIIRGKNKK